MARAAHPDRVRHAARRPWRVRYRPVRGARGVRQPAGPGGRHTTGDGLRAAGCGARKTGGRRAAAPLAFLPPTSDRFSGSALERVFYAPARAERASTHRVTPAPIPPRPARRTGRTTGAPARPHPPRPAAGRCVCRWPLARSARPTPAVIVPLSARSPPGVQQPCSAEQPRQLSEDRHVHVRVVRPDRQHAGGRRQTAQPLPVLSALPARTRPGRRRPERVPLPDDTDLHSP